LAVSSGFNTNVRVGEQTFHVQTEDRGPSHPVIDTVVYLGGRILHRRSSSYQEFMATAGFTEERLRHRVEEQHRTVVESLRDGSLAIDASVVAAAPFPGKAIEIRILKFAAGADGRDASVQIQVLEREKGQPISGAAIELIVEGAPHPLSLQGISDAQGQCELRFAVPAFGNDGAAIVVKAVTPSAQETIRYSLRPKAKSPAREPQK
jgi:hypothetical protein